MNEIIDLIPEDFSSAVLVSRNSKTLFEKGSGFSDIPDQIYNTVDTKFQTASAGKMG